MKTLLLTIALIASFNFINAQANSYNTPVPNSGANTTVPPANTLPQQNPAPSVPSNSTAPGSTGSYTVDPAAPNVTNPGNSGFSSPPSGVRSTNTSSPQTGTHSQKK